MSAGWWAVIAVELLSESTALRATAHDQVGERDRAKVPQKFETEAQLTGRWAG